MPAGQLSSYLLELRVIFSDPAAQAKHKLDHIIRKEWRTMEEVGLSEGAKPDNYILLMMLQIPPTRLISYKRYVVPPGRGSLVAEELLVFQVIS